MASSNRHWPSMFKSKLCSSHHQWQHHDLAPFHHKNPYSSSSGCEERSPEPKPRWNPKPEQIRILEAIFNSGMVNPPRDEIRKIRAQLQEFGQVGDANVFYWFQNRKSRTKNKQRHLQGGAAPARLHPRAHAPSRPPASTSSSSSSSEQSTASDHKTLLLPQPPPPPPPMNPTVYSPYGPGPAELGGGEESLLLPPSYCQHQGRCFSAAADVAEINASVTGAWGEVLIGDDGRRLKMQLHHLYAAAAAPAAAAAAAAGFPNATATVTGVNAAAAAGGATGFATPINELQVLEEGEGYAASSKSIVFAAEAVFEVAAERVNVGEVFGAEAVLLDQSGRAVLTDEWGVTVHPLQQGASYYLV